MADIWDHVRALELRVAEIARYLDLVPEVRKQVETEQKEAERVYHAQVKEAEDAEKKADADRKAAAKTAEADAKAKEAADRQTAKDAAAEQRKFERAHR